MGGDAAHERAAHERAEDRERGTGAQRACDGVTAKAAPKPER